MKKEMNSRVGREMFLSNLTLTAGLIAAWIGVAQIIETRHRNRNYPHKRLERVERLSLLANKAKDWGKREFAMAKDVVRKSRP